MNIILLSDMHLKWDKPISRLDQYPKTPLRKFRHILETALSYHAAILQAGDMFDSPRSWYMLPQITQMLRKCQSRYELVGHNFVFGAVFGQHDQYYRSETSKQATTLGVLVENILIAHLGGEPLTLVSGVDVYGCDYGWSEIPKIQNASAYNILVVHQPVLMKKVWSGQEEYDYAPKFMTEHEYDLILCGDIHAKFMFKLDGKVIVNTGPLLRNRADDDMFKHKPGFYLFNTSTKKLSWKEVPHEPAEKVLSTEHLEREKERQKVFGGFVEAIQSGEGQLVGSFQKVLDHVIEENKISKDVVEEISIVMEESDEGD